MPGIRELFFDPLGLAYDEGRWISPIGGHSDHVHVSFADAASAVTIMDYARGLGLRTTENPYVGSVAPGVHTSTSYHYKTFAERVNGRPVGMALDASGSPDAMTKFARWVEATYTGKATGPGGQAAVPAGAPAAAGSGSAAGTGGTQAAGCLPAALLVFVAGVAILTEAGYVLFS